MPNLDWCKQCDKPSDLLDWRGLCDNCAKKEDDEEDNIK